jgi:Protein of unknown function (DUF4240)
MNREQFWALVESTGGGGCEQHAQRLKAELGRLPLTEILAFGRIQRQLLAESYRWDLWGAAYLIQAGCGDNGFDAFRGGWLIGQGRAVFEAALRDPDSLAEHPQIQGVSAATRWELSVECEDLLFAADDAYEAAADEESDFHEPEPEVVRRMRGGPAGEDWDFDDEDELRRRYPKLWGQLAWDRFPFPPPDVP